MTINYYLSLKERGKGGGVREKEDQGKLSSLPSRPSFPASRGYDDTLLHVASVVITVTKGGASPFFSLSQAEYLEATMKPSAISSSLESADLNAGNAQPRRSLKCA